jgi:hypothetical protein
MQYETTKSFGFRVREAQAKILTDELFVPHAHAVFALLTVLKNSVLTCNTHKLTTDSVNIEHLRPKDLEKD